MSTSVGVLAREILTNKFVSRFQDAIAAAMAITLDAVEHKLANGEGIRQVRKSLNVDRKAKWTAMKAAGPVRTPTKRAARQAFVAARLAAQVFAIAHADALEKGKGGIDSSSECQKESNQRRKPANQEAGKKVKPPRPRQDDPVAARMAATVVAELEPLRRKVRAAKDQPSRKAARTALMVEVIRIRSEYDQKRKAARAQLDALPTDAPAATRRQARKVLIAARTALQTFCKSKPGQAKLQAHGNSSTAAAPTSEVEAPATTKQQQKLGNKSSSRKEKHKAVMAALDAKVAIAANQKAQELAASATLAQLRAAVKAAASGPERKQARATLQAEVGVIKAALDSARKACRQALADLPNEAPLAARTDAQTALATARVTLRAFCRNNPGKVEVHSKMTSAGKKAPGTKQKGRPSRKGRGKKTCAKAGATANNTNALLPSLSGHREVGATLTPAPSTATTPATAAVTVVPAWVDQAVVRGQALSAGLEHLRAVVRAADNLSPAKKQARTNLIGEVRRIRTELDDARKAARAVLEGVAKVAPAPTKAAAIRALVTARTTLQAFDKTKPRKAE
jgi:hypothetical protein